MINIYKQDIDSLPHELIKNKNKIRRGVKNKKLEGDLIRYLFLDTLLSLTIYFYKFIKNPHGIGMGYHNVLWAFHKILMNAYIYNILIILIFF